MAEVGRAVPIIAKIERPAAVESLDAILNEAHGVMVARGDLGLEMPLEQVPRVQKRIIRSARALGRPVIVATQVLESMREAPRPTRAEVSDAANAVEEGADAIMRKFWFAYLAKALVIFPGGFGTIDEMFEILTLAQTRKLSKKLLVILYGSEYWNEVFRLEPLAEWGAINERDLNLLSRVDSVDEAFDRLQRFLMKYHMAEGFDELYSVAIAADGEFTVQPMTVSAPGR